MQPVRGSKKLWPVSVEAIFESNRFPTFTPDCKADIFQKGEIVQDIWGRCAVSPYDLLLNSGSLEDWCMTRAIWVLGTCFIGSL